MNFFGLSTDGIKMEPGTYAEVKVKAEIMGTSGPADVKIKVEEVLEAADAKVKVEEVSGTADVKIKVEEVSGTADVKIKVEEVSAPADVKIKVEDTSGPSNAKIKFEDNSDHSYVKIKVEGTSAPAEVKAYDMKICVLDDVGWKATASSSDEDDFDSVPTQNCSTDWIWIENKTTRNNKRPIPEANKEGKWLIFLDEYDVDDAWERMKYAVQRGDLGHKAKVSTKQGGMGWSSQRNPSYRSRKRSRYDSGNNQYVIGVYTYDWNDVDDVNRVRGALLSMDFRKVLHYKTEEDTNAGIYSGKRRNISKYSF